MPSGEDLADYMGRVASRMRMKANLFPCSLASDFDAKRAMEHCQRLDAKTGASLFFTKDCGHHSSGWFKNPDYDCCYHLSIASIASIASSMPLIRGTISTSVPSLTRRCREQWAKAFFDDAINLVWVEPSYSEFGKRCEIYHYRVFVDVSGAPLLPRGEVYTREFTKAGWKSWSDAQLASMASRTILADESEDTVDKVVDDK